MGPCRVAQGGRAGGAPAGPSGAGASEGQGRGTSDEEINSARQIVGAGFDRDPGIGTAIAPAGRSYDG